MRGLVAALGLLAACGDQGTPMVAVTFNTGTTLGLNHDGAPEDGYGTAEATISDEHYGDGLAWSPVVEDTVRFFAELQPDVVAFQEIFHPGDCAVVPPELHAGFVCETWTTGDPTVAQRVVGEGYQVACHQGKSDKCVAVKRSFGTFRGCDANLCLDFLDGAPVPGCGSGSRVGRGLVELTGGGTLTVVSVHGSSGIDEADAACRVAQFEQIFVDLDGEPAANGERNLILGDLNTDPGRYAEVDPSAAVFAEHVGPEPSDDEPFHFVSEVGRRAPRSYQGIVDIDHVASDAFDGSCTIPGVTDEEPVSAITYFDHAPVVCTGVLAD